MLINMFFWKPTAFSIFRLLFHTQAGPNGPAVPQQPEQVVCLQQRHRGRPQFHFLSDKQ